MEQYQLIENKEMTLLDLLDGIIDTGVVVSGELVISIANIDLIMVDLKLLISSIESAMGTNERKIREEEIVYGTVAHRLEQGGTGISQTGPNDN